MPEMAASRENGFKAQKGGTRMVKVTKDDVNSLRTNLGDELYDKTIGSLKTTKVEPKKEAKVEYKQLKEYGGHTYGRNSATDEWKKIK